VRTGIEVSDSGRSIEPTDEADRAAILFSRGMKVCGRPRQLILIVRRQDKGSTGNQK
jgi:hypothetical protein